MSNVGIAFNTGGVGGGIFNDHGAVDIIHSRIGFNTASVGGGKLKGHVAYRFLLTAPNGKPDALRIKIWDTATGAVVYDNQPGAADGAAPTAPLGGGNIIIH